MEGEELATRPWENRKTMPNVAEGHGAKTIKEGTEPTRKGGRGEILQTPRAATNTPERFEWSLP